MRNGFVISSNRRLNHADGIIPENGLLFLAVFCRFPDKNESMKPYRNKEFEKIHIRNVQTDNIFKKNVFRLLTIRK